MRKSYIFPCSKCGKGVEHSINYKKATCFDCRKFEHRARMNERVNKFPRHFMNEISEMAL